MFRVLSRMNWAPCASFRASSRALQLMFALLVFGAGHLAQAQTYKVLHSFIPNGKDGLGSSASLVLDAQGNLYGTTADGGKNIYGTVFKITSAGKESVLHAFGNGGDGKIPMAGLIQDSAGNLYGTTLEGGAGMAFGAAFKLNKAGAETMLYSFDGTDGELPEGGLIRDSSGNLYGTTLGGGKNAAGTVFKLSKGGTETILYNFGSAAGFTDGALPAAGLIQDAQGNLYGTTEYYGANGFTGGTVFKLDPSGVETVLYSFTGQKDGSEPVASLIQDGAGNFYGTTMAGGNSGNGTVFELSKTGTETVLHSFTGGKDGGTPVASLIQDTAGNLYGTSKLGGKHQNGVVFELTPGSGGKWKETVLYNFSGGKDGGQPLAGVIQDGNGTLYGTASLGGKDGFGVVFKLVP